MSRLQPAPRPSPLGTLAAFVAAMLVTMLMLSQLLLSESGNSGLHALARAVNQRLCEAHDSAALCLPPDVSQIAVEAPAPTPAPSPPPVASRSNPASPFGELAWQGGSEAQAAAFVTTIKTLAMRHFERNGRYLSKETTAIIGPVFRDYPALVSASACIYCGDVSEAVRNQLRTQPLSRDWAMAVGRGIGRYLPLLAERQVLDDAELQRLARVQAQLGHAGSSDIATFVTRQLLAAGDTGLLQKWVSRGLNGGQSFDDESQLLALPREVAIDAWRHGVAIGYDAPLLTEYLLKSGYRPALRWLVWLQDGGATYLHDHHYKYHSQHYAQMLAGYTDFPVSEGAALGRFYSDNWRQIRWDGTAQRWRH